MFNRTNIGHFFHYFNSPAQIIPGTYNRCKIPVDCDGALAVLKYLMNVFQDGKHLQYYFSFFLLLTLTGASFAFDSYRLTGISGIIPCMFSSF